MFAELLGGTESYLYFEQLQHAFPHLFQEEFTTAQIASLVEKWSLSPDGSMLHGVMPREKDMAEENPFEAGFRNVSISLASLEGDESRWGLWFVLSGNRDAMRIAWTGDIKDGQLSRSHTVAITLENDTANKQVIYSQRDPTVARIAKWPRDNVTDISLTEVNLDERMQGELEGSQEGHKIQIINYAADAETNAQMLLFEGFPTFTSPIGVIKLPLYEEPNTTFT